MVGRWIAWVIGLVLFCGGPCFAAAEPTTAPATRPSPQLISLELGRGVTMKFAPIPAGTFIMGSPENEQGRVGGETQHKVTISRPFYMGVTEITQAQWRSIMLYNPSYLRGDELPVEQVSWDDAVAFCRRLSARTGKPIRLPTEAEWEYACRAGTKTAFYTGEGTAALDEAGWYEDNAEYRTHPVGLKKPNAWGLYDMHGNVFEWCSDWYGEYPPGEARDPTGPPTGLSRILRGGSWYRYPEYCRAAYRYRRSQTTRRYNLGCRMCMDN